MDNSTIVGNNQPLKLNLSCSTHVLLVKRTNQARNVFQNAECNWGRFPFRPVWRSDHSAILKWNALVQARMAAHGSEPLSSPAPVGHSAEIWRVFAGKLYVRALNFFSRPERTDGKRPKKGATFLHRFLSFELCCFWMSKKLQNVAVNCMNVVVRICYCKIQLLA